MTKKSIAARAREALAFAQQLRAKKTNWLEAHNALYGIGGKGARLVPTQAERSAFARTEEHRRITEKPDQLPEPAAGETVSPLEQASGEPHVRLPRSLHAALP